MQLLKELLGIIWQQDSFILACLIECIVCLIMFLHFRGQKTQKDNFPQNDSAKIFSVAMLAWAIRPLLLIFVEVVQKLYFSEQPIKSTEMPYWTFIQYEVFIIFSIIGNLYLIKGIAGSDYAPANIGLHLLYSKKWALISFFTLLSLESLVGFVSLKQQESTFEVVAFWSDISISLITLSIITVVFFNSFKHRKYNLSSFASFITLALAICLHTLFLPNLIEESSAIINSNLNSFLGPSRVLLSLIMEVMIGVSLFSFLMSEENLMVKKKVQNQASRIVLAYNKQQNQRPYKVDLFLLDDKDHKPTAQLSQRPFIALLALSIAAHLPGKIDEETSIILPAQISRGDYRETQATTHNYLGSYNTIKRLRNELGIKNKGILINNWKAKRYSINISKENIVLDESLLNDHTLPKELKNCLLEILTDKESDVLLDYELVNS